MKTQTKISGKSLLRSGALQFIWAEIKTLNKVKFKALWKIIKGYVRMKYLETHPPYRQNALERPY